MGRWMSRHRWRALVAVVAGLAVLGVVVALSLSRPAATGEWSASHPPAPTVALLPEPPVVLGAADSWAPAPTAEGVRTAIDSLVRDVGLGDRISAEVVDVATGVSLYRRRADSPTVPASTIKLVTAATVLAGRGPAYQIPTTVAAGDSLGEVVLVGGGDPTLAIDETGAYPGAARLDLLAAQVLDALGDVPIAKVIVDSTLFTGAVHGPWDEDIPNSGYVGPITALMTDGGRVDPKQVKTPAERWREPDLAAGRAFAELLGLRHDVVERGEAPPAGRVVAGGGNAAEGGAAEGDGAVSGPAPGAELGRVESPPILRLVEIMLTESDNVVAEALARQVALAHGQPASFPGVGVAMEAALAELGLPAGDSVFADGSGLSRANRLTAGLATALLVTAASPDQAVLAGLVAGLPVAGWSGTLAERYRSPQPDTGPGAGVVRAKTGTLNGVHAIAGTVVTADGRLLAFAFLADDVPIGQTEARDALDQTAATLATCGCG